MLNLNRSDFLKFFMLFVMIFSGSVIFVNTFDCAPHEDSMNFYQQQPNNFPLSQDIEPEEYRFDVIDIRGKGYSFDEQLMLASVEGLVNRNESNVFFLYSDVGLQWLNYLNTTIYRGYNFSYSGLSDIINRYATNFSGIVVFNSSSYDEVNLATPLAGVYDALLVPNSYYSTFRAWYPATYPVLKNVTANLEGKSTRLQKYEYALVNYYPLCNQSAFSIYAGDIAMHMRSFIVKNNLFTIWRVLYVHTDVPLEWGLPALDPDPSEELQFFEDFLNSTPDNIPVYGFMWPDGGNEGQVIRRISAANKYLTAADFFENLPFFSSMHLPDGYEFHQNRPAQYRSLENKIYISGIWSDGDNIQYLYNYMRPFLWTADTPSSGLIPTGWTLSPSLYHLAPYVAKFYYENASANDYFIGALSGKGYAKMDYFTNRTSMVKFLQESQVLWDRMDMREARIWQLEETAQEVVNNVDLEGIFDSYLGSLKYRKPIKVDGTPIIKSVGVSGDPNNALEFIKEQALFNPVRPQFYFFHIHCWLITAEMWKNLALALQQIDGVVLVRPDELVNLMQQWDEWGNEPWLWALGIGAIIGLTYVITKIIQKKRGNISQKIGHNPQFNPKP